MGVITRTLSHSHPSVVLATLSSVLGWIYTLAWSASFYPQVIHNFTHKSTLGLSTDFVALNAVGHSSYLLYNTLLLYYEPVRRAYRKRHGGEDSVVQVNDFIFSLHATLLALITLAQFLRYRKVHQGVSRTVSLSLAAALTVAVFLAGAKRLKLVTWLEIVNAASTLKLILTLTKYLPQIKLNKDRQSTKGFAIENILLDLTGGVLSLAQLLVDAVWIQGGWNGVWGDGGKLGLGLLSIFFDGVLIWQHYGLYGPKEVDEDQEREETGDGTGRRRSAYGSVGHPSTPRQASSSSSRRSNHQDDTESSSLLR